MIWELTRKEVLNKILDFRFIITTVIAIGLLLLTTAILSEQYLKEVNQYREFIRSDEAAIKDTRVFSQLRFYAHYPPSPLSIFNKGVTQNVDKRFQITHVIVPRQTVQTSSENPFMNIFQFFDLSTIFMIVMSLLAILLVYDSIAGEREDGTLKAMLSNAVPRYAILLSKVLASIIGLAIAIVVSLAISFLMLMFGYGITYSAGQWLRVGCIVISMFLFLGFFITAGLLISSLVKRASVALIWLTFLWVILVVIQPHLGTYLAAVGVEIPSREQIEGAERVVWEDMNPKIEEIETQIQEEVPGSAWHAYQGGDGAFYFSYDGNRTGLMRYVLRTRRMQPLIIEYGDREWQVYRNQYESYLENQLRYQRLLNTFSPAALFNRLSASFSGTDIASFDNFLEQVRSYRQSYLAYLREERKIFSENANLYFTRLTMEQIEHSDFEERLENAGGPGNPMKEWGPDDYAPLALGDMPRFSYNTPSITDTLGRSLLDATVLLLISIFLFYCCTVSFNRYDARQG